MSFPLYRCCDDASTPDGGLQGRLIFKCGDDPALYGAEDVVHVPLFEGTLDKPGNWPAQPLPEYEKNLALLRELAPRVKGVITGNNGIELGYKHQRWQAGPDVKRMVKFVELTAPLITETGGVPVYGPFDWETLFDAYTGAALAKRIRDFGGWQIIFCGFTLVPGAYMAPADCIHFQGAQRREIERLGGDGRLRDYLAEFPVWTGVCGQRGMELNPPALEAFGFRAGIVRLEW